MPVTVEVVFPRLQGVAVPEVAVLIERVELASKVNGQGHARVREEN